MDYTIAIDPHPDRLGPRTCLTGRSISLPLEGVLVPGLHPMIPRLGGIVAFGLVPSASRGQRLLLMPGRAYGWRHQLDTSHPAPFWASAASAVHRPQAEGAGPQRLRP